MSDQNPNGNIKGGVILGGREMRVTVTRDVYNQIAYLAAVNKVGPTEMAVHLLATAAHTGLAQFRMAKILKVLITYPRWGAAVK